MDSKDRKILACLREDARRATPRSARPSGLSSSAVHDRVRKLEKKGIIKAYRADIDLEQTGYPITAIVSIALSPTSPTDIPAKIAEFNLVESCYSVAGDNSYALVVRAPTTKDLEITRRRAPRKAGGNNPHHDRPLNAFRGPAR